jgi:hypothetical protein
VPIDNPTHVGQANAGVFKFIGVVQPLKNAKEFNTIIPYRGVFIVTSSDELGGLPNIGAFWFKYRNFTYG